MILADTSVWVDHFRHGDRALGALLDAGRVLMHPFVIGELALGNLNQRAVILESLSELPESEVATDEEVLRFINTYSLAGAGIGYVDAHLLSATRLSIGSSLWTRDRRLQDVAGTLGLAAPVGRNAP